MQVFLVSAPPEMPALCGHFCFCLILLLADQATFSPPLRLSEWAADFHLRLHGFLDNGWLAFGFRPVFSGCLAKFFKIVLSTVRDIFRWPSFPSRSPAAGPAWSSHSRQTHCNTLWERVHPRTPAKPVPFTTKLAKLEHTKKQCKCFEFCNGAVVSPRLNYCLNGAGN